MKIASTSHVSREQSDEDCALCAARTACGECFDELLRRFQTPLLHFLLRRTGQHDAEDLLQETFLAAHKNLHRYQSTWRFSTWIFTIANRLAISEHRKRRPATMDSANFASKSGMNTAFDQVDAGETRSKLWNEVQATLDPDAFTAVWLNYVEMMSAEQIGQVIGRNANAVRIVLHRARLKLAPQLSEYCDER